MSIASQLSFSTATSVRGGGLGSIPYQGATSATLFVSIGAAGTVLTSSGTVPIWAPASSTTVGTSTQVNTVLQTSNGIYYLAFVDSNNASATAESVYTTSSFLINPSTGVVGIGASDSGTPLNVRALSTLSGTINSFQKIFSTQASGGVSNNVYRTEWRRRRSAGTDWTTQNIHDGIWVDASFTTPGTDTRTWWERDPNTTSQAWGDQATTWMFVNSTGLGVGTTSPQAKFVVSNAGANGLEVSPTGGISSGALIQSYNRSGATYTQLSHYALGHTWQVGAAGSTRAVDIDSSGNVGIGVSSPASVLHARNGSLFPQGKRGGASSAFFFENATVADLYLELANTVTNYSGVLFSRAGSGNYGLINYNNATDNMVFYTSGTVKATITSAGGVAFGSSQTAYGTAGQILQSNGNASPTWVPVSGTTVGTSTQVQTVLRTTQAAHFLTFVDSNNATATAESLYTTSTVSINPQSGQLDAPILSAATTIRNSADYFEKVFPNAAVFPNLVANQAVDIRIGNISVWGYVEVEVNSSYSNQNSTGKLTKLFAIGTNPSNLIYANESRVVDTLGTIDENIAIGEFQWDATNTTYKIPVSHIVTSGNNYTIKIRCFGFNAGADTLLGNTTISSVYTLTALSAHTGPYYNTNFGLGGQTLPSYPLDVTGAARITGSLGIGTLPSGIAGEIRATNEITAYYSSDIRLKENIRLIADPITIVNQIRGVYYDWTDEHIATRGGEDGYFVRKHDIGVIAQEVEKVLPEIVATRDDGTKVVKYEKLVALLIEAVKDQQQQINQISQALQNLAIK